MSRRTRSGCIWLREFKSHSVQILYVMWLTNYIVCVYWVAILSAIEARCSLLAFGSNNHLPVWSWRSCASNSISRLLPLNVTKTSDLQPENNCWQNLRPKPLVLPPSAIYIGRVLFRSHPFIITTCVDLPWYTYKLLYFGVTLF